jgi:hypothetical protein
MPDSATLNPPPEPDACGQDEFNAFEVPGRPFANWSTYLLRIQLDTATSEEERDAIEREMDIRNGVTK